MNKLFFLLGAATTAVVLLCQRAALLENRAAARQLGRETGAASDQVREANDQCDRLEARLGEERSRARELRQSLAEWNARPEPAAEFPATLEPGQRWPQGQSWCYLPKHDLTRYGFTTFQANGRLSNEAALLFGMSRAQRAAVDDAYAELNQELEALDVAGLRPVATLPEHQNPEYHYQSFELEPPPEQSAALRAGFENAVRSALPGTQGDLFLQANESSLDLNFKEFSYPLLRLTTYAEPDDPDQEYRRLDVEYIGPLSLQSRRGDNKCFYPDDETAAGFRRYADIIRSYLKAR